MPVSCLKEHLENISADKVTDWLNCDNNDIGYEELMDHQIIQNVLNFDKPEANLCDKS